jgi:transposase
MDWPLVSPDLSLIENVWSVVELLLHKAYKWRNLKAFKKAGTQAWDSVTYDDDFRENL